MLVWSAQFPALEVLQIYHSGITDDGLAHLQELHHLRILTLFSSSKISSGGMKWLRHLPLQEIDLSQTAIDDDAARVFREIGTLNRLELFGTAITDKSLQVFAQMPQLKVLDVTGTRVSRMGVKQLRALRPDLTVFCSEQSL